MNIGSSISDLLFARKKNPKSPFENDMKRLPFQLDKGQFQNDVK